MKTSPYSDFIPIRTKYSGRATIKHWKKYYNVYKILFPIFLCKDLIRNLKKNFIKRKQKRQERKIEQWQYRPVSIIKYARWIDYLHTSKDEFVEFTRHPYKRKNEDPKIYAFYLTQFHPIPENDHAYGKGFTEWTNVASATPQFVGHHQPKIPYDLGFYNLLTPGIMERQVELAKAYGIYGFCFYYYWFSGKKLLEKPLEYFLHSNINFHFHLCWATENWSKRWDGGKDEIIVEQKLQESDADKFFTDLLPYISDSRYEKINGKPVLIIYRVNIFEKQQFCNFLNRINSLALEHGFGGIYFLCTNAFGFFSPEEFGCEGLVEFPPHAINSSSYAKLTRRLSSKSKFTIVDMDKYIKNRKHVSPNKQNIYKTCFPGWDNTPRKTYTGGLCFLLSPNYFKQWLIDNISWTKENYPPEKQITYINAWNEWGEGAILEPNLHQGYQKLAIVKQALEHNYHK